MMKPSESLDTFNSGKVVTMNVKEYIHSKDHQEGCTGCVTCMKSKLQHRIVNYKYPKTIGSRYTELYKGSKFK